MVDRKFSNQDLLGNNPFIDVMGTDNSADVFGIKPGQDAMTAAEALAEKKFKETWGDPAKEETSRKVAKIKEEKIEVIDSYALLKEGLQTFFGLYPDVQVNYIKSNQKIILRLTGMDEEDVDELIKIFNELYDAQDKGGVNVDFFELPKDEEDDDDGEDENKQIVRMRFFSIESAKDPEAMKQNRDDFWKEYLKQKITSYYKGIANFTYKFNKYCDQIELTIRKKKNQEINITLVVEAVN